MAYHKAKCPTCGHEVQVYEAEPYPRMVNGKIAKNQEEEDEILAPEREAAEAKAKLLEDEVAAKEAEAKVTADTVKTPEGP